MGSAVVLHDALPSAGIEGASFWVPAKLVKEVWVFVGAATNVAVGWAHRASILTAEDFRLGSKEQETDFLSEQALNERKLRTPSTFSLELSRSIDTCRTVSERQTENAKDLFLIEFTKNKGLPIGGGLWIPVLHPELRLTPPYTSWTFAGAITRMPEVAAPALGNKENRVSVDADVPANPNG